MNKKKAFLIVQSVLCIALAVVTALAAVNIYRTGVAFRAAGNPTAWIYSRETVAAALRPCIPLFLATVAVTILGAVLGIRDENRDRPVKDGGLMCVKSDSGETDDAGKKAARTKTVRILLLLLAAAFIIAGIVNGSMRDVMYKAIKICTECIGLG